MDPEDVLAMWSQKPGGAALLGFSGQSRPRQTASNRYPPGVSSGFWAVAQ